MLYVDFMNRLNVAGGGGTETMSGKRDGRARTMHACRYGFVVQRPDSVLSNTRAVAKNAYRVAVLKRHDDNGVVRIILIIQQSTPNEGYL